MGRVGSAGDEMLFLATTLLADCFTNEEPNPMSVYLVEC